MRKLFIAIICLCVVFVVGFTGLRAYEQWEQRHLVNLARKFMLKKDGDDAVLCLRQALQSNPNNLEACRMMADFSELARSPQAIVWRKRVMDLEPNSLASRLALVRTAIALGDAAVAQKALDSVEAKDRNTAAYHKLAGAADVSAGFLADAEAHFSQAARLEPDDAVCQLNLATLRLQKTDALASAEARAVLQSLRTNPVVRCDALRQLTQDALHRTNLQAALTFSQDLLADTNSAFTDRLLHLDLLTESTNARQASFLVELQQESANSSAKTYEVAKRMLDAAQAEAALAWIESLPRATRTNLPVPIVEADCYIALKDWYGLETNLAGQNWLDVDCLRLACRARGFKEQGSVTSAKTEWLAALQAAGTRRDLLAQLANTTTAWQWPQEQEDVLWVIANRYPTEKTVIQALAERLFAAGETRSLQTLYSLALQNDAGNLAFMNNLATTALLLGSWEKKPHELAREAYARASTNASFASTYAYSLLVQQKPTEALKTIEQLTPQQLENPSIAAYYGLILEAAGNTTKAKRYLELASKARLLPEEQKLVAQARLNLNAIP
jgi:predicted Zn-dependent protease